MIFGGHVQELQLSELRFRGEVRENVQDLFALLGPRCREQDDRDAVRGAGRRRNRVNFEIVRLGIGAVDLRTQSVSCTDPGLQSGGQPSWRAGEAGKYLEIELRLYNTKSVQG